MSTAKTATMEDLDIALIEDEIIRETKKAHTRSTGAKKIKVRSSVEKARDDYKAAKALHREQIKKLKASIQSHKLLIKQAKNSYKLVKLAEKGK